MSNQSPASVFSPDAYQGLHGFYRGEVIHNIDPDVLGRIKVWVPTLHPKEFKDDHTKLPWCEGAMFGFGGSGPTKNSSGEGAKYKVLNEEVGVSSVPHVGAQVLVIFERGNINTPIYTFAIQAGRPGKPGSGGWLSEHPNQYVIKTDKVKIRIDDEPKHKDSTSKFSSPSQWWPDPAKGLAEQDLPTELDIEVLGNVNIKITGNVNLIVKGDVAQEIEGDHFVTHKGNYYEHRIGDCYIVHDGNTVFEHRGNRAENITGNYSTKQIGNVAKIIAGTNHLAVSKNNTLICQATNSTLVNANLITVETNHVHNTQGTHVVNTTGPMQMQSASTFSCIGNKFFHSYAPGCPHDCD